MQSFLDLAKARKSVRKYKTDPIDGEALKRILEAGRTAPSGNNSQPWRFVIVDDAKMKEALFTVASKQRWILEAPITIAVIADITAKLKSEFKDEPVSTSDPRYNEVLIKSVRDATIAADHIVMAATDEGLGTCWIALYEQEDIRPVLGVPDSCYVVSIITIGYADQDPKARPRRPLAEIAFKNRYGKEPFTGC